MKKTIIKISFGLIIFSAFLINAAAQSGQSQWTIKRQKLVIGQGKSTVVYQHKIDKPYHSTFYKFKAKAGQILSVILTTNKTFKKLNTELVFIGLPQTAYKYGNNGRLKLKIPADYDDYEIGVLSYRGKLTYKLSVSIK